MKLSHHLRVVLEAPGTQDSDHDFVSIAMDTIFPECRSHALIRKGHQLFVRLDEIPMPSDEALASFCDALGAESVSLIDSKDFWSNA